MRGETIWNLWRSEVISYFNPLPSCEGRRKPISKRNLTNYFNPLPSCEGRPFGMAVLSASFAFQSTPLMRGETLAYIHLLPSNQISIHSPHARGDTTGYVDVAKIPISIHSPHARGDDALSVFKFTLPISIHSPHARGDSYMSFCCTPLRNFNPLPSCEGRLVKISLMS